MVVMKGQVSDVTKDLLLRISRGDNRAFRTFFDTYYPRINRFTSYIIRSNELREEVVSDFFLTVWKHREKLCKIKDLDAYLYTIARHLALDSLRKILHCHIIEEIPLGIASADDTPEEQLLSEELCKAITQAVNQLPERCKLVFLMAKEQGLKYKEIAKILQISEKTVNAQMVIALKKLNLIMRQYMKSVFF